jgi:hypothetical protein
MGTVAARVTNMRGHFLTIEAFHKFNQSADLGMFELSAAVLFLTAVYYRQTTRRPTLPMIRISDYALASSIIALLAVLLR